MTINELSAFGTAYAAMCDALGGKADESKTRAAWDALVDLQLDVVRAGLRMASREWRGMRTLPRPSELREYCQRSQAAVAMAQGGRPMPLCDDCGGGGWLERYCIGRDTTTPATNTHDDPAMPCQRDRRHDPHGYMVRCRCRAMRSEVA